MYSGNAQSNPNPDLISWLTQNNQQVQQQQQLGASSGGNIMNMFGSNQGGMQAGQQMQSLTGPNLGALGMTGQVSGNSVQQSRQALNSILAGSTAPQSLSNPGSLGQQQSFMNQLQQPFTNSFPQAGLGSNSGNNSFNQLMQQLAMSQASSQMNPGSFTSLMNPGLINPNLMNRTAASGMFSNQASSGMGSLQGFMQPAMFQQQQQQQQQQNAMNNIRSLQQQQQQQQAKQPRLSGLNLGQQFPQLGMPPGATPQQSSLLNSSQQLFTPLEIQFNMLQQQQGQQQQVPSNFQQAASSQLNIPGMGTQQLQQTLPDSNNMQLAVEDPATGGSLLFPDLNTATTKSMMQAVGTAGPSASGQQLPRGGVQQTAQQAASAQNPATAMAHSDSGLSGSLQALLQQHTQQAAIPGGSTGQGLLSQLTAQAHTNSNNNMLPTDASKMQVDHTLNLSAAAQQQQQPVDETLSAGAALQKGAQGGGGGVATAGATMNASDPLQQITQQQLQLRQYQQNNNNNKNQQAQAATTGVLALSTSAQQNAVPCSAGVPLPGNALPGVMNALGSIDHIAIANLITGQAGVPPAPTTTAAHSKPATVTTGLNPTSNATTTSGSAHVPTTLSSAPVVPVAIAMMGVPNMSVSQNLLELNPPRRKPGRPRKNSTPGNAPVEAGNAGAAGGPRTFNPGFVCLPPISVSTMASVSPRSMAHVGGLGLTVASNNNLQPSQAAVAKPKPMATAPATAAQQAAFRMLQQVAATSTRSAPGVTGSAGNTPSLRASPAPADEHVHVQIHVQDLEADGKVVVSVALSVTGTGFGGTQLAAQSGRVKGSEAAHIEGGDAESIKQSTMPAGLSQRHAYLVQLQRGKKFSSGGGNASNDKQECDHDPAAKAPEADSAHPAVVNNGNVVQGKQQLLQQSAAVNTPATSQFRYRSADGKFVNLGGQAATAGAPANQPLFLGINPALPPLAVKSCVNSLATSSPRSIGVVAVSPMDVTRRPPILYDSSVDLRHPNFANAGGDDNRPGNAGPKGTGNAKRPDVSTLAASVRSLLQKQSIPGPTTAHAGDDVAALTHGIEAVDVRRSTDQITSDYPESDYGGSGQRLVHSQSGKESAGKGLRAAGRDRKKRYARSPSPAAALPMSDAESSSSYTSSESGEDAGAIEHSSDESVHSSDLEAEKIAGDHKIRLKGAKISGIDTESVPRPRSRPARAAALNNALIHNADAVFDLPHARDAASDPSTRRARGRPPGTKNRRRRHGSEPKPDSVYGSDSGSDREGQAPPKKRQRESSAGGSHGNALDNHKMHSLAKLQENLKQSLQNKLQQRQTSPQPAKNATGNTTALPDLSKPTLPGLKNYVKQITAGTTAKQQHMHLLLQQQEAARRQQLLLQRQRQQARASQKPQQRDASHKSDDDTSSSEEEDGPASVARYWPLMGKVKRQLTMMRQEEHSYEVLTADMTRGASSKRVALAGEIRKAVASLQRRAQVIRDAVRTCEEAEGLTRMDPDCFNEKGLFCDANECLHTHTSYVHVQGQLIDPDRMFCCVCGGFEAYWRNDIILCDGGCRRAYHMNCCQPCLTSQHLTIKTWLCPPCTVKDLIIDELNSDYSMGYKVGTPWHDIFAAPAEQEKAHLGGLTAPWLRVNLHDLQEDSTGKPRSQSMSVATGAKSLMDQDFPSEDDSEDEDEEFSSDSGVDSASEHGSDDDPIDEEEKDPVTDVEISESEGEHEEGDHDMDSAKKQQHHHQKDKQHKAKKPKKSTEQTADKAKDQDTAGNAQSQDQRPGQAKAASAQLQTMLATFQPGSVDALAKMLLQGSQNANLSLGLLGNLVSAVASSQHANVVGNATAALDKLDVVAANAAAPTAAADHAAPDVPTTGNGQEETALVADKVGDKGEQDGDGKEEGSSDDGEDDGDHEDDDNDDDDAGSDGEIVRKYRFRRRTRAAATTSRAAGGHDDDRQGNDGDDDDDDDKQGYEELILHHKRRRNAVDYIQLHEQMFGSGSGADMFGGVHDDDDEESDDEYDAHRSAQKKKKKSSKGGIRQRTGVDSDGDNDMMGGASGSGEDVDFDSDPHSRTPEHGSEDDP